MSNLFLGSSAPGVKMTAGPSKGSASGASTSAAAHALSLDELDRPSHCPEGVDQESWRNLCLLRRRKIASEEEMAVVVSQLAETEDVNVNKGIKDKTKIWFAFKAVAEREISAERATSALSKAKEQLSQWRKDRNYELSNVPILLTVKRGQIETPLGDKVRKQMYLFI